MALQKNLQYFNYKLYLKRIFNKTNQFLKINDLSLVSLDEIYVNHHLTNFSL